MDQEAARSNAFGKTVIVLRKGYYHIIRNVNAIVRIVLFTRRKSSKGPNECKSRGRSSLLAEKLLLVCNCFQVDALKTHQRPSWLTGVQILSVASQRGHHGCRSVVRTLLWLRPLQRGANERWTCSRDGWPCCCCREQLLYHLTSLLAPANEWHQGCLAQEPLRLESPELGSSSQQLLSDALLATRSPPTVRNLNTSCVSDPSSRRLRTMIPSDRPHYSLQLQRRSRVLLIPRLA